MIVRDPIPSARDPRAKVLAPPLLAVRVLPNNFYTRVGIDNLQADNTFRLFVFTLIVNRYILPFCPIVYWGRHKSPKKIIVFCACVCNHGKDVARNVPFGPRLGVLGVVQDPQ